MLDEQDGPEPNESTDYGDFYISYNPNAGNSELGRLCSFIRTKLTGSPPRNGEETALCIIDDVKRSGIRFLILTGDHRAAYKQLAPDLKACLEYFKQNAHQMSDWSDPLPKENLQ